MTLLELCYYKRDVILEDSVKKLEKAQLEHYKLLTTEQIKRKMLNLFHMLVKSIEVNSSEEMMEYMDKVSDKRHEAGYELQEVQSAINMLEEIMWEKVSKFVDDDLQISAIKQVTRLLSKAKIELADEYSLLKS